MRVLAAGLRKERAGVDHGETDVSKLKALKLDSGAVHVRGKGCFVLLRLLLSSLLLLQTGKVCAWCVKVTGSRTQLLGTGLSETHEL